MIKTTIYRVLTIAIACSLGASTVLAQGRTVARLFWQDDATATLRWGDLKKSADGFTLNESSIEEFPDVDVSEQSLVEMTHSDGLLLVGVHDQSEGSFGSGWVAIESGAIEEPHGDHSHWKFTDTPKVTSWMIDKDQGNPAHVYRYGKSFVIANDAKNGFTLASAQSIRDAKSAELAATFLPGGNGHITLAVVENQVAYATWIAPVGDDSGRVDVVGLGANAGKTYSIHCPTGGLHGATTNSGKVFFAPSDGVCWVTADASMSFSSEDVTVGHLPLGKDANDKPLRTGAFTNLNSHVVFTSGKQAETRLCWIDASATSPTVGHLMIPTEQGESLSSPIVFEASGRKQLAMMFAENKESPESDRTLIVDLDPNADGNFADAVVKGSIAIGRSAIQEHSGHHDAAVLPGRRQVAITNPGDGSIWIVSLADLNVIAKLNVEGTPTRLTALGG